LTNFQACQSFRRQVSPMTGLLGIKNPLRGKSTNKRLVPMPRQLNKHLLNPISVLLILPILIPKKIGLLSVYGRTNKRVTPNSVNALKRLGVKDGCCSEEA
jgi:hypothetical protein